MRTKNWSQNILKKGLGNFNVVNFSHSGCAIKEKNYSTENILWISIAEDSEKNIFYLPTACNDLCCAEYSPPDREKVWLYFPSYCDLCTWSYYLMFKLQECVTIFGFSPCAEKIQARKFKIRVLEIAPYYSYTSFKLTPLHI